MSLSKVWATCSIAFFCALALIVVASPTTFASTEHQSIAQSNCPLLSYGSTDANSQGKVSVMQWRLRVIGHEDLGQFGAGHSGVDGIFGSVTLHAVKDFQSQNGLEQDGLVGPKTWAALGGCTWTPPTKCEIHPDAC